MYVEILRHTKWWITIFTDLTKNKYKFDLFTPDCSCCVVIPFLLDNLREKRSVPPPNQSGSARFRNSRGAPVCCGTWVENRWPRQMVSIFTRTYMYILNCALPSSFIIANKHLIKSLKTTRRCNLNGCIIFYHACIIMYLISSTQAAFPVSQYTGVYSVRKLFVMPLFISYKYLQRTFMLKSTVSKKSWYISSRCFLEMFHTMSSCFLEVLYQVCTIRPVSGVYTNIKCSISGHLCWCYQNQ